MEGERVTLYEGEFEVFKGRILSSFVLGFYGKD